MRDSKNILHAKLGVSPMERQYGGGLDAAYMNRRRSSAFADPDATSAFASPMSMDGLPTIYRDVGGTADPGQGGDFNTTDEEDSYSDEGIGYNFNDSDTSFDPYPSVDPGLARGTPSPTPSAPSDSDDPSNYVTDKRYAELYGRSGDGRPSFTSGTLDPDTGLFTGGEFIYDRPGGPEGPSQQDYINRLNKEGFPEWTWPYYNSLKARGMTNEEATSMLAAAMSTPGGLSGMQSSYGSGYSYGGPLGTMGDLLEKGMASRVNINNLLEEDKDIKAYNKDDDEEFLSQGELVASGLKGIAGDISNLVSLKANLTPTTMELIDSKFTEAGLNFTPASGAMGTLMNFLVPSVAKGLSNLTGAGRTIGTVTDPKTGQSFNVSDTGKFSLNLDPTEVDYGNDPKKVKKSKPQKKKAEEEKKKKSYMKDYFASLGSKEGEGGLSDLKNYYETQALKYIYPDKSDEEINIMINKP